MKWRDFFVIGVGGGLSADILLRDVKMVFCFRHLFRMMGKQITEITEEDFRDPIMNLIVQIHYDECGECMKEFISFLNSRCPEGKMVTPLTPLSILKVIDKFVKEKE